MGASHPEEIENSTAIKDQYGQPSLHIIAARDKNIAPFGISREYSYLIPGHIVGVVFRSL